MRSEVQAGGCVSVTMNRRRTPSGSRSRQGREEFRDKKDVSREPEKEGARDKRSTGEHEAAMCRVKKGGRNL